MAVVFLFVQVIIATIVDVISIVLVLEGYAVILRL
jgi:hypothetical protein